MNKKNFFSLGIGIVMLAYVMNLSYAVNDYGIVTCMQSLSIFAQSGSSGDGSSSGSSSSSSSSSGVSPDCKDNPNNSNGGNLYLYCDKKGKPKDCTLYKYIDTSGNIVWSESSLSGGFTYTGINVNGKTENCPKKGKGCTVYSCHQTLNTTQ